MSFGTVDVFALVVVVLIAVYILLAFGIFGFLAAAFRRRHRHRHNNANYLPIHDHENELEQEDEETLEHEHEHEHEPNHTPPAAIIWLFIFGLSVVLILSILSHFVPPTYANHLPLPHVLLAATTLALALLAVIWPNSAAGPRPLPWLLAWLSCAVSISFWISAADSTIPLWSALYCMAIILLFVVTTLAISSIVLVCRKNGNGNNPSGQQQPEEADNGNNSPQSSPPQRLVTLYRLRSIAPILWPSKHPLLLLCLASSLAFFVSGRVVSVLMPMQYKILVDLINPSTSLPNSTASSYVYAVLLFVLLRFLQTGLIANLQDLIWTPLAQHASRSLSVRMLAHLLSLSLRYHTTRKSGELLRVLDRGTSSIVSLLQLLLLRFVPVVLDIAVAVCFFAVRFDLFFATIVLLTMVSYIALTVVITEWRLSFRRKATLLDNRLNQLCVESLMNYETIKYFTADEIQVKKYAEAYKSYNRAELASQSSLTILNLTQNVVISLGLLAGSLLCAHRVVIEKEQTLGDFVLFLSYIAQLYAPLNWFGTVYRIIQQNFTDMEKMLALFDEDPDLVDQPGAVDLILTGGGEIEFKNVSFSYSTSNHSNNNNNTATITVADNTTTTPTTTSTNNNNNNNGDGDGGNTNSATTALVGSGTAAVALPDGALGPKKADTMVLRNLSFCAPARRVTAIVGPSGAGKSTILRLLFRSYDPTGGTITVDGQDVRGLRVLSLRRAIAVVPQDTVLFNDSVYENILFGRPQATAAEVEAAARAAQIHEKIVGAFPKQYATQVGERGLRLSGGERQRMAIARAVLKDAPIIVLDEATSSLDTNTERNLKVALSTLCRNRTTVVVAHRLSTIRDADLIVVVSDGVVAESGTHEQLLLKGGLYHALWHQQEKLEEHVEGGAV